MTALILCNIGGRDVMLQKDDRLEELRPARLKGQEILALYEECSSSIRLPIIQPALQYILERSEERNFQVRFFGTNQKDQKAQATDTIYFAEIAALRVPEIFGEVFGKPDSIEVDEINPAFYDETFEKYDRLLEGLRASSPQVCYVILAGGTPACNTALLLQSVRCFGDRLQIVYPPQGGEPQLLRIGRQVMGTFKRAAAIEHLKRLDFSNALPYLEELGVQNGIAELVDYAAQRFSFDFQSAQATLEKAMENGDIQTRTFIRKELRHNLDVLLNQSSDPQRLVFLLKELYWNAVITYQHCRYADFLGRVYRFQEAVLRYMVEIVLGVSTDLAPSVKAQNIKKWEQRIIEETALHAYLEAKSNEGAPLDWRNVSRTTYKAILTYKLKESENSFTQSQLLLNPDQLGLFRVLLKQVNALDRLVELRHRTIIGHGFEGVSEEMLHQATPGHVSPVEYLSGIMPMLGQNMRDSDFHRVVEFAIHHI